jgi:O-methyltransferase
VSKGFSMLASFEFLQNIASRLVAGLNPNVIHNVEKYYALNKVHYLSAMENMEGDYLEFGVFTGSSLCHSIRCCRRMKALNPAVISTRFFGFDSFAGFGRLGEDDRHPFYTDIKFETVLSKVDRRVSRAAREFRYQLVPGFFEQSLKDGPRQYGIEKARIVFIDSDTYASARDALAFCRSIVRPGTFIVLDDFYSYRGSWQKGVARAFREFTESSGCETRHVLTYGMGGSVFVISKDD